MTSLLNGSKSEHDASVKATSQVIASATWGHASIGFLQTQGLKVACAQHNVRRWYVAGNGALGKTTVGKTTEDREQDRAEWHSETFLHTHART